MFSVYIHTNKSNGKKYVGITSMNPERRWNNGNGYQRNPKFWAAIQSFGWDAFLHDVVAEGLTEKQAVALEEQLIAKYDSVRSGYNNSYGGRYAHNGLLSHECNEIMHNLKRYSNYPGFSDMYRIFEEANYGENQNIYERLNMYAPAVLKRVSESNGYKCPRYCDVNYLSCVVYEFVWLFRAENCIKEGKRPPKYIPYNQAIENAILGADK